MYALDFCYDGKYLSDFGFIICDFDPQSGFNIASAGSNIVFNKVPYHQGKRHGLAGTKYEECIQTTFGICKNPDIYDDLSITNDEYRDLMRWLNRNEYLKFHVQYEYEHDTDLCYYDGSFNVSKVKVRETLYGLELTFESNRPFGYGEEIVHRIIVDDTSIAYKLRDRSDEIGYTYPAIKITCNEPGDLTITNDLSGSNMVIKNCIRGEVINIDCENCILSTSKEKHDICNDFNYDYLKIGNTIDTRDNNITSTLNCVIEIRYSPIIKDTP